MGNADSKQPGAGSPQKGSAQAGHIGTFEGNEISPMERTLQRHLEQFSSTSGVENMKIVLRGARRSGKTTLLKRLQGLKFDSEYDPTKEIKTTHVEWNYRASDEMIKMEVWDVVDKAITEYEALKLSGISEDTPTAAIEMAKRASKRKQASERYAPADAENVEVYKNANAVILLYDCGDRASFDMIKQYLRTVPKGIPILILANKRDLPDEQRVVDLEEAKGLADSASKEHIRPIGGSRVVAFEASLKDCFGLKVLYNYFNVPYLEAKLDLLNSLMQEMRKDLTTVREELNCYIENLDYQSHLEWRNLTKGQQTSQQKDSFADVMEDYEKTQRQNQEQERRQVSRGESRNSQASSPSQDDNNKQQRQYSATCGFKVSHDEQNESRTQPKSKDKKTSKKNKEKNSKSSEGTKKKNKKSKTKKKESSEESKESESQKQMHGETTKQDYSTNNDALDIAPPKPALGSSLDDFFSSEEDEGKESPIAIRKPGEGASVYSCGDDLSPSRDARKNQNNETNSEKSSDTEGDEDTDGVDLPPTKPDYASDSSDEVTPRRENQHRSKVDSVDNAPIPSKLQQKSPEPKHNLSAAQPSVLETQEDSVPSSVPEDHAGDLVSSVDMSTENTQAIHAMFSASDDDDDEYSSTQNNEGRDDDMAARSTSEYKNSYTDDVYSANKSTGINNVESLEWPAAEVSETKVSKVEHQYRPDRTEADEVNDTKGEVPTTHSESDDVAADRVHSSGHAEDGDDDSTQQETTELPSNQLSSDRDDFVDDDFAPPIPSSVNNMDSFLDSEEDEADEPSGFEAQVKSSSAADDDEFNFKPTVPAATGVGENLDDFLGDEEEEDYTPSLGNPSKDSVKSYERAVATNIGTSTKTSSSISSSAVAKALEDAKAQWENEEKDSKKSKKKSKKGKKNKKNKSEDKE